MWKMKRQSTQFGCHKCGKWKKVFCSWQNSNLRSRKKTEAMFWKYSGSTEIWTRIAGFRVLSANHYTIEPLMTYDKKKCLLDHRLDIDLAHPGSIPSNDTLKKNSGSTEIWTRIAGFRVLSANHYTMEPCLLLFTFHRCLYTQLFSKGKMGSSGIWTRDLSHPKRESYP